MDLKREIFDLLLKPRSVVLIGASATPGKWGLFILHNLLKDGYDGKVYAVGRKGAEALGIKFFGGIEEIKDNIDLALIAVPPASVLSEVERCIEKGIKAIYVITGGFAETSDPEGIEVEKKLKQLSQEHHVAIAGPNGQGILNTHINLCAQMFFTMPPKGGISLITQSGNIGVVLSNFSLHSKIGMSKIISTGNAACLDIVDFLKYLSLDEETRVICVYVEGTKRGRELTSAIESTSRVKPVIIMKAGNTGAGKKAALSHSAALAGSGAIFEDACRSAGAIVVNSLTEMWDSACILSYQPPLRGRNIGILTLGGGLGVVTADIATEEDFEIKPLPEELKLHLDRILPPRWSRGNPIDLAASEGPTTIVEVLNAMARYGNFDAIVFVGFGENGLARHVIETGKFGKTSPFTEICEVMKGIEKNVENAVFNIIEEKKIPVIGIADAVLMAREIDKSIIMSSAEKGFFTFPTPERGIKALKVLYEYSQKLKG